MFKFIIFLFNLLLISQSFSQVTGNGNASKKSPNSYSSPRISNILNLNLNLLNPLSRFKNKDPFSGIDAMGVKSGFGIGIGHEFVRDFFNKNNSNIKVGFKQILDASYNSSKFESNEPDFQSKKIYLLNLAYRLGICSKYYVNNDSRIEMFLLAGGSFNKFSDDLSYITKDSYVTRSFQDKIVNFSYEIGVDFSYSKYYLGLSYFGQKGNNILIENISSLNSSFNNSNQYKITLTFNFIKVFLGLYF